MVKSKIIMLLAGLCLQMTFQIMATDYDETEFSTVSLRDDDETRRPPSSSSARAPVAKSRKIDNRLVVRASRKKYKEIKKILYSAYIINEQALHRLIEIVKEDDDNVAWSMILRKKENRHDKIMHRLITIAHPAYTNHNKVIETLFVELIASLVDRGGKPFSEELPWSKNKLGYFTAVDKNHLWLKAMNLSSAEKVALITNSSAHDNGAALLCISDTGMLQEEFLQTLSIEHKLKAVRVIAQAIDQKWYAFADDKLGIQLVKWMNGFYDVKRFVSVVDGVNFRSEVYKFKQFLLEAFEESLRQSPWQRDVSSEPLTIDYMRAMIRIFGVIIAANSGTINDAVLARAAKLYEHLPLEKKDIDIVFTAVREDVMTGAADYQALALIIKTLKMTVSPQMTSWFGEYSYLLNLAL